MLLDDYAMVVKYMGKGRVSISSELNRTWTWNWSHDDGYA